MSLSKQIVHKITYCEKLPTLRFNFVSIVLLNAASFPVQKYVKRDSSEFVVVLSWYIGKEFGRTGNRITGILKYI